jgi:hypothetical protein
MTISSINRVVVGVVRRRKWKVLVDAMGRLTRLLPVPRDDFDFESANARLDKLALKQEASTKTPLKNDRDISVKMGKYASSSLCSFERRRIELDWRKFLRSQIVLFRQHFVRSS